jgi:anti-sigma B factor antagonist
LTRDSGTAAPVRAYRHGGEWPTARTADRELDPLHREEVVSAYGFQATERILSGVRVVAIEGELDIATSPQVRGLLDVAARDPDHPLVVDLTSCSFIDSTGLATLLHGTKPAQNGESHLALVSTEGEVRKLLELTAIDRTIPVFETLDQAVAAVLGMGS